MACGGTCFTIPHVDLATSGDYICSAVNGVGHPQHATITLHVLCKLQNIVPIVKGKIFLWQHPNNFISRNNFSIIFPFRRKTMQSRFIAVIEKL